MRLIDADALKTVHGMRDDCAECDKEERRKSVKCEYDRVFTKMDFCGWLDDAPTVDAAPVRRGRWKMKPDPYGFFEEIPVCPECGCTTEMRKTYNYCPFCGADMREEDGDETD